MELDEKIDSSCGGFSVAKIGVPAHFSKEVTSKGAQPSEDTLSDSMELNTGKSNIVEEESTTPVDKKNIPREWRHNGENGLVPVFQSRFRYTQK
uniref:Uncharacterized protein n=1 Tax=Solanum lycopersicum TaxID=4081 RepID=A0A3Q7IWU0_SOLLC